MEKEEEIKKLDPQVETEAQAVTGQELSEEELESVAGGGVHLSETHNFVVNSTNPGADIVSAQPLPNPVDGVGVPAGKKSGKSLVLELFMGLDAPHL